MDRKFLRGTAAAITAFGIWGMAASPGVAADHSIATNVPGVRAYPAPPAGFNPSTATPQELEDWGLPVRPDPNANPVGYARWERAVTATRIIPQIEVTDIYHRPRQVVSPATPTQPSKSTNWSGYIVSNANKQFSKTTSFGYVAGDFVVPWALQPFKTCGTPVYVSEWVGIDGNGSDTALIQAGVSSTNTCTNGNQTVSNVTWFEWFPLAQMNVTNFPTEAGDDYYVWVESTGTATKAKAYLLNYVENVSTSIKFSAPKGSKLIGNTAEWIVEAPTVGGGQTALANYSIDYFAGAEAETFGGAYSYPGDPASGIESVASEMINKSGAVISVPELIGPAAIYFHNQGSSR